MYNSNILHGKRRYIYKYKNQLTHTGHKNDSFITSAAFFLLCVLLCHFRFPGNNTRKIMFVTPQKFYFSQ